VEGGTSFLTIFGSGSVFGTSSLGASATGASIGLVSLFGGSTGFSSFLFSSVIQGLSYLNLESGSK